ncbi:MAG: anti-sigma factor [Pseudomonadota bacterium]
MNWYHHPAAIDQLASAYVLGTLQGRARRRFEAVLLTNTACQAAVADWTQRLVPLLTTLPPMQAGPDVWERIAGRAGIVDASPPVKTSFWRRWLAPVFVPIPAGSLAVALLVGLVVPVVWQSYTESQRQSQLPESYVGVLATAQGKPGLIVSSLRYGRTVEIKQMAPGASPVVPAGQTLYLWRIDKNGNTTPLGPIPDGKWVRLPLAEPAEKVFFSAVELAVSLEAAGSSPVAPGQAFVYRGLCGKLWR